MDGNIFDPVGDGTGFLGSGFLPGPSGSSSDTGGVNVPIIVPLPFPGAGTISIPGTIGGVDILNPLASVADSFNQKLYSIALTSGTILLAFIIFAIGLYTIVSE